MKNKTLTFDQYLDLCRWQEAIPRSKWIAFVIADSKTGISRTKVTKSGRIIDEPHVQLLERAKAYFEKKDHEHVA